ncbi:MAG: MFS transporter [Candidatus Izemoplasmatales bacterium]|nr:MFS transporter [Candidatus Izemoplasmatales bacterium]
MNEIDDKKQIKQGFKNIVLLGLVSLFVDLSTEMVYPLVTIYLSTFASVAIIGVIEGLAESVAAILKSYSGYIGDKFSNKKILAFIGYSSAIIYKILLFFSLGWVGILIAKLVDRIGKGIRTAPRDALVAESGKKTLGKAFGLHKMLDMLGSALGIILAIVLYSLLVDSSSLTVDVSAFKTIFLISIIPALLGIFCLIFVKETKHAKNELQKFSLKGIHLEKKLILYLIVVFIFSIGNSSNAFLVLRVTDIGFTPIDVLILYLVYNLTSSVVSYPLGKLSDKIPRRKLVIPAYILYAVVYLGIALFDTSVMLYILFAMYGVFQALIAGAEKAYVTENAPSGLKGTVLGLYGTAQGLGLLFASFIAGAIWTYISIEATFVFAAIMSLVAAISLVFVFKMKSQKE